MTVTVYHRHPRFFSSTGVADGMSRWNPYHVLCLIPEDVDKLVSMLSCSETDAKGKDWLKARQSAIRSSYLDLAARFHPDSDRPDTSTTAPWISTFDHFAAISTAYRILSDPLTTLEFALALETPVALNDVTIAGPSEV